MSGHSKWSTIKRKKGAEDAKRGKIFTRLARDVMMAAKEGGGDESMNPKLALAVSKAKAANMPKDNIERAIKRGTGELEGGEMFEITYEAYGSDGVAFVIETLTDNKNRTIAAVKAALNKNNGSLASSGSVTFQFEQKGYIVIKGEADFDELFMVAAEAGAEDVVNEDDTLTVYTARDDYGTVEQALSEAGYETEESELRWFAQNELDLPKAKAVKNLKLQEALEDLDDVQSVSSNLAISDEVVAEFETA
ncbi:MAG: YebC/PmpR family DNA-binding transcriptional regulator [Chloroflexota bacterium]